MDSETVRGWEARCSEEQPPACTAACPLQVDVRAMLEKTKAGDFASAFAIFARVVPLPGVVADLCEHPCEAACRRGEAGGEVGIGAVERALVAAALATLKRTPQHSRKPKRVAVVGAGMAGLTAACDLAMKGHRVTVLEAAARPLGWLPAERVDADLVALMGLGIVLECDAPVADLDALVAGNDAVVLAPGAAPPGDFAATLRLDEEGGIATDPASLATSHPKVFNAGAAGALIEAARTGRRAATSVDRMLQGASLTAARTDHGGGRCVHTNVARHPPLPPVEPADAARGYTKDEAMAEAARCLPCHCLECVRACEFLALYRTYPKRAVREIFNNDSIIMGNRKANRMIDGCTLCGLCAALCPDRLAMGEVCLEARQSMVARGHMPASHHEFALRDMAFSRSDWVAFHRHQPCHAASAVALFPGCQLVASSPGHVGRIYRHLAARLEGGVGLIVDCCGAPAHWSGRRELHGEAMAGLDARWQALGRPVMVTACATCLRMLGEFRPGMVLRPLWTVLDGIGWPDDARPLAPRPLAIHDPCTGRDAALVQQAVRRLAGGLGAEVHELDGAGLTTCCGFGGLASFANPEVADRIVDRRGAQRTEDYLTYCAMCRDNFARRGKRALHLLDLAFPPEDGSDPAARPDPGFSRRRDNRASFRRTMLRTLWGEEMNDPAPTLPLVIADAVRADMERKLILAEDVAATVAEAEHTGRGLKDPANGHLLACRRIGNVTVWVEYGRAPEGLVVHRAYSHRMTVEAKP